MMGFDLGASYTKIVFRSNDEALILKLEDDCRGIAARSGKDYVFGIEAACLPGYLPGALKYAIYSPARREKLLKAWKDMLRSTDFPDFANRETILDLAEKECVSMVRAYLKTRIFPIVSNFLSVNPGIVRYIIPTIPNGLHFDDGHVKQLSWYKQAIQDELCLSHAMFPPDVALEGEALAGYQLWLNEIRVDTTDKRNSLIAFDCGHSSIVRISLEPDPETKIFGANFPSVVSS